MKNILLLTVLLCLVLKSYSQATDPTPYRGLYVDKFILTNDPTHTILGSNQRETELLEFAKANNIKRLDFYTLYPTFNGNWSRNNPLTNNTYGDDYCSLANRAKHDYCIEQFAASGSSSGFFTNINVWNTLIVTAPFSFSTSHIPNISTFFSAYSFVQNTYTASDGNIALVSEYLKCYLRIIDSYYQNNSLTGCKFNVFDIEYEYWRSYTNYDWAGFTTLLNALVSLNANTSYHFKIHIYTVLKDLPPNAPTTLVQDEADFIDPKADRIYLTDYPTLPNNNPGYFWNYSPFTPGVVAFKNSSPSGTLITPLFNSDGPGNSEGLYDWLNDVTHPEQNLFTAERIFLENMNNSHLTDVGNSIITKGSFQWFMYTPTKQISSNPNNNQYCTNNELFYISGATNYCPTTPTVTVCNPLTLSYIGNYETGVSCDWDFGDNATLLNHTPVFVGITPELISHTYSQPGTYTVHCHAHFPPSLVSPGTQTCDYEFHRDVTIIGATVYAGNDQTICGNNIVHLNGTFGGTATSATWSSNGTGNFNIISSPTAIYTPSAADIVNGQVQLTFTTNDPSGSCAAVNDDVKIIFLTSPGVSISPAIPNPFCGGGSVQLTASGASSYDWSQATGLSCINCSVTTATPAITTTYTVIGTGINGCTNSGTVTVTVNPAPRVSVSPLNPLPFCAGGSGITLTASNATSYSWSPSQGLNCTTCSVVNANPSVTTTYTIVGTGASGCTNSSTTVVTIMPNPPVSITPGGTPCIGTQLCTNAVFNSYSWLPNHETTSCIPTSAAASNYSVTATNANGCTSTASASLNLSCCGGGTLLDQAYFNSHPTINAGVYNLNSSITLIQSTVLNNCQITAATGVGISTGSFTLTLQNGSTISSCSNMWRGIIVNSGGNFKTLPSAISCKIYDAQYGVDVRNGGNINVDKCEFINDWIGINLADAGSAVPITVNGFIKNAKFYTSGALKPGNPSGISYYQYSHSFAGIRAINISLFSLGINNGTSVNYFYDLNYGVYSLNSNLVVTDYSFHRIKKYDNGPSNADANAIISFGSAVYSRGDVSANFLTMNGRKSTTDPDFQDCRYGVNSSNSSIDIQNNRIENCDFGIYVSKGNSLRVKAIKNYIDCNIFGISLILIDRYSNSFLQFNEIYGGLRATGVNGTSSAATGINVAGYNLGPISMPSTNAIINQNTIHLYDYGLTGIKLNAIKSSIVNFNYVTLHNLVNNTMKGISLSGSLVNNISCNSVQGTYTSQINYSTGETAFDIYDSRSNDIKCNSATQTSNGIRFSGTCHGGITPTTLRSNDIGNHYNGLVYTASALVDPQLNMGNWWYLNTYAGYAATNLNPSPANVANEKYEVYANLSTGSNLPSSIFVAAAVQWFFPVPSDDANCGNIGSHRSDCNLYTEPYPGSGGGGYAEYSKDEMIALDQLNSSTFNEETKWKDKVALYEKLLKMPDYKDDHQVLSDFYQSMAGTTIQKVASINVSNDEITSNQEALLLTIENNSISIYQKADTIRTCDSTLTTDGLNETQKDNLIQLRALMIDQIKQLADYNKQAFITLDNLLSNKADLLNNENNEITSSEVYEQNEKIINEIYLNGIVKDDPIFFFANSSNILAVAEQCPLAGGPAVHRARSLYMLIDPEMQYDDDLACLQSGWLLRIASKKILPIGVYPNPASSEVTITYNIEREQILQIVDGLGRISMSFLLNPKESRTTRNISTLSDGIYTLRISGKDNMENNIGRLTIMR